MSLRWIAALLVLLGAGQLMALFAILNRYAIPRSPRFFHFILAPPMLVAAVCAFLLADAALTGQEMIWHMDVLLILTGYFASAVLIWWTFVAYTVYHLRRRRRESEERTTAQDERDERQDARSLRQTARGVEQDKRGQGQDERSASQDQRENEGSNGQ